MPLESLTGTKFIDALVSSNPATGDSRTEGDDHIRGIKNVLLKSFPRITGAVTATQTELNYTDITTLGTAEASKALTADASGDTTDASLISAVLTTPQINDTSSDHQYIFVVSELTTDRNVTLPLLTTDDEFVFKDHTVTLTNKTLTAPVINGDISGGSSVIDDDTMASASATTVSTSESVKAYVDSTIPNIKFGRVGSGGATVSGSGFTSARISAGVYRITPTVAASAANDWIVVANVLPSGSVAIANPTNHTTTTFDISVVLTASGVVADREITFHFHDAGA